MDGDLDLTLTEVVISCMSFGLAGLSRAHQGMSYHCHCCPDPMMSYYSEKLFYDWFVSHRRLHTATIVRSFVVLILKMLAVFVVIANGSGCRLYYWLRVVGDCATKLLLH